MPPGIRTATIRIKPIVPKKFKANAFYDEIAKALKATQDEIEEDFALTTWSWNHRPAIQVQKRTGTIRSGGDAFVRVYTRDPVYIMLEFGTRAHVIRVRYARALRYQSEFRPKTTVRFIGSRPGGKSGNNWITRYRVWHPGHESRLFTVMMRIKQEGRFVRKAQWAMAEGARLSGHKI